MGKSRIEIPSAWPPQKGGDAETSAILREETSPMEWRRHEKEQNGHRQYGIVHRKEKQEDMQGVSPEEALDSGIAEHPWLMGQLYDGASDRMAPPSISSLARREFDNQRREQDLEHQMKLGLMPGKKSAPEPRP